MLRSVAFGLLLPGVSALCLINGTEPAARKNLVNPNGETYPLGFYVGAWAAADATTQLAAIVIQEMLGFNVSYHPGPDTPSGFYAITGCVNYSSVSADKGCGAPVTYIHVNTEAWVGGYPQVFAELQTKYKATAPKDLASLGYEGRASIFFPSELRREAYATEGLPLEYYAAWDARFNEPGKYLDTLPSFNASINRSEQLAPCSASLFSDPTQMGLYFGQTGDADGVIQTNGTVVAKCVEDYFWVAQGCRSNHSRCVVYITGGGGWGLNVAMQQATAHNMPLAIAVAGSWSSFTQLPRTSQISFYWWVPDTTFLSLSPIELEFPPYDRLQYESGDFSGGSDGVDIRTAVSGDLGRLAPKIEDFLSNLRLDMKTLNSILLDNLNRAEGMNDTACRWLQNNQQEWEAWLPDDTKCFPGFGLFDDTSSEFVSNRDVPEGIRCQPCPSGTFSSILLDSAGKTYTCEPCPAGTAQPSGAQQRCVPCSAGEYQDELRQLTCKRCAVGYYQESEGAASCTKCPAGSRTLGQGSPFATDCGCDDNRIDVSTTGALECVQCSEGLLCPAMGTKQSLITGNHSLGAQFVAEVAEGYYVTREEPLKVYKCGKVWQCPGGRPNTCAGGRDGVPCAECPQGQTWSEGQCTDCEAWKQVLWAVGSSGIFVFLTLSYYLMTSKVTAKASVLFTTTCAFGMLVSLLQSVGIIGMMTVEWPLDLKGFFSYFQFLLLDLDSFGFACFAGAETTLRYTVSVLFFPMAVGWLLLNYGVSRLVPRFAWDGTKVASCVGQVLQVGFSTMSTIALAPLMCYSHPNDLQSLLKHPNVICGSPEHAVMLVGGLILLVVGVLGFLSLCTFAAFRIPHWSAAEKHGLVRCFRFLVFRFRLDSWWFGVPLLVRGPLISLPIVLATDYQSIQTIFITSILAMFLVLQALAWPWKVPMLNALDSWMSFCILILVAGTALYVEASNKGATVLFVKGYSMFIMVVIFSSIGTMILMALAALFHRAAMGGSSEYAVFNLTRTVNAQQLAEKMQDMAELLAQMDEKELEAALDSLSVFDTRNITSFMTMASAEIIPESKGRFSYGTRVTSASFSGAPKPPAPTA